MEQWKRIKINNKETKYEISNLGRCRNTEKLNWKTKGVLKPKKNKKTGYFQYCIVLNGKDYYKYVHRLVAICFIEGDHNLEVNHKDGDKSNNHADNLEWVTKKENMRHCFDTGLSTVNKPIKQYSLSGEYMATYSSASEAERILDVKQRSISNALTGKHVTSNGYQWRFLGDEEEVIDVTQTAKKMNESVVQLTKQGEFIAQHNKITHAYASLGKTDNGIISQVCKGNRNSFAGFKWMYAKDYYNIVDEDIVYAHSDNKEC